MTLRQTVAARLFVVFLAAVLLPSLSGFAQTDMAKTATAPQAVPTDQQQDGGEEGLVFGPKSTNLQGQMGEFLCVAFSPDVLLLAALHETNRPNGPSF